MVRPRLARVAIPLVALLLAGPVLLAGCAADAEPAEAPGDAGTSLEAPQFARAMSRDDVTLVDVRTPIEHGHGHVSGARNLNLYDDDFEERLEALDPEAAYAVYCRDGQRSRRATALMAEHGFTRVFRRLEGGLEAWMAYGGGITRE